MSSALPSAAPQIPDYELLRAVGRGAYGDVWLTRSVTGAYRAIKVVWRNRFVDAEPYEREFSGLCDYARISINERRQLALLHVGRNDPGGFFYYVMELADDVETGATIDPARYEPLTMSHYRDKEGLLPVRQLVAHAVELSRALASLHAHGLVHRDIKPSNIIVVDGQPKLADIGLVAPTKDAKGVAGTEGFAPPEGAGTPAADVFSLGKVLYELAMVRDRNDYPRLALDFKARPDRQELMELNEVIVRACDPSPTLRYPNAEALLKDLLLLQSGRSVRRLRLTERGLARARRFVALLTVVAGIAAGGAWLERQRAEQEAAGRQTAEAERDQLARITLYSAALARAQRALETTDYGRARELLRELIPTDASTEDLRGFEWRVLWHEAQGDPAEVIRDSGPAVDRVYFSPDGQRFAIHDASKVLTIYDAETRLPLQSIAGLYRFAGFSADSQWLLGTTPSYLLQAFNVATGEPIAEPQGTGFNHPLASLPGASPRLLVLTGGKNLPVRLRVWDLAARRELNGWPLPKAPPPLWEFRAADVLVEGPTCLVLVHHDRARTAAVQQLLIDLTSPSFPISWELPDRANTISINSHVERILAAGVRGRDILNGSLDRAPIVEQIDGTSEIGAIAHSPDRGILAVGSKRGALKLLHARTGRELHHFRGHGGAIMSIAWAPSGSALLTSDNLGHVRYWQLPVTPEKHTIDNVPTNATGGRHVHFSTDGQTLAVGLARSRVGLFSASTFDVQGERTPAQVALGFLEDGSLISMGPEGSIQRWQRNGTLESEKQFAWKQGSTLWATVNATGAITAAASKHGELLIEHADPSRPAILHRVGKAGIQYFVLSPAGDRVAAVVDGITVHIWRTSDGKSELILQITPPVEELSFSENGLWLAACLSNGDVGIVNLRQRRLERTLQVSSAAASAAFTPDHKRLVCAGRNGLLHVYRTTDWREVATLVDPSSDDDTDFSVADITFSPDSTVLAVLRRDGKLRLWRAP